MSSPTKSFHRLRKWQWFLVGLWLFVVLWLIVSTIIASGEAEQPTRYGFGADFPHLAMMGAAVTVTLNMWALAAMAGLAFLGVNPLGWINRRRMIWGGMALAIVAGRFALVWVAFALAFIPPLVQFIVFPVLLFIAGLGTLAVLTGFILIGLGAVIAVPVMIFNTIFEFERNMAIFRYQESGLAGYLVRFHRWLTGEKPPPTPPDDSKGARLATDLEVEALQHPEGMGFGYAVMGNPPRWDLLRLHTDKHVLIMASTRSGKGVSLIIPHLLRYQGSAFVLDPKGENAKATGRTRARLNDQVHYLDPFGISGMPQARFNPLSRFTPANMEAESKALAAAFVMGERDHWTASAQQLLAAVILYTYATPDLPPDKKDLVTVRRYLLGSITPILELMAKSDLADGLVSDLAKSFLETPERERGSIISNAQRETEILDNPFIAACLAATGPGEEVDFKAWHSGTMTVYLCLSAPKFPVFNRWLRLVLTSALDEMTDTLRPPKRPVCFMLDELATLGHLQTVENAIGLAAGYGVQLVTVFQDVAQMRDLYKGRWASFVGNAGVRALFNLDDYDTADYWSKFIGGHEVERASRQVDLYGYSGGENVSQITKPMLAPEELMRLFASQNMLVLAQGERPILSTRRPYFQDESLTGLWDDPRPDAPDQEPEPSKASNSLADGNTKT